MVRSAPIAVPTPQPIDFRFAPGSVQDAFLQRAMQAINRIAGQASQNALLEALSAPTDVGALARALGNADVVGSATAELDPLAGAIALNAEHRLQLLGEAGGTLSGEEAGKILGISRQAVDKRRRASGLLAMRQGSDWAYPRFQFEGSEVISGIPQVLGALEPLGPWVALDFLLAKDTSLGGLSPLAALRRGEPALARQVGRLVEAERGHKE